MDYYAIFMALNLAGGFCFFVMVFLWFCYLAFTISFYFGIAGFVLLLVIGIYDSFYFGIAGFGPQPSHSFATAQKSNQKRPPLLDCPCGVPEPGGIAYEPALMRRPGAQG